MWSGPGALLSFRPCSNFMMPFTEMSMSVMLVYLFLASGGTFSVITIFVRDDVTIVVPMVVKSLELESRRCSFKTQ